MKIKYLTLLLAFPMLTGCVWFNNPGQQENVPVEYVECAKHRVNIEIGKSEQLQATIYPLNATNNKVSWTIDDSDIADIDIGGKVTGKAKGTTKATVTTEDGNKQDFVEIYTFDSGSVQGVELNESAYQMSVGDTKTLIATVTPSSALNKNVTWVSSNESVATVSNGVVTALSKGFTNITVTTVEGNFTAVCAIKVGKNDAEMWDSSQDSLRNGTKTLSFYSFNDLHGTTAKSDDGEEPGINLLSSYVKYCKAQNPDGFVLTSSGDMWQGSADSNITRGRLVIDWMNMMGFSAMAIGNHEFDWTINQIKTNQFYSDFDMLACNIVETETNKNVDWVKPYTTITKNGVHIGIIGAIGEGITSTIVQSNVKGLEFKDPNPYIVSWSEYLREQGADVVLVLLHDPIKSISTSTAPYIDGIFGGHTHQFENSLIGGVPAIQASCNGKGIGAITLEYDFDQKDVVGSYKRWEKLTADSIGELGLKDDEETKAMYQKHLDEEIADVKNEVVCTYTGGIEYSELPYVYDKYAYNYFNDVHKNEFNYPISFVVSNQARSEITASPNGITYGDLYKSLPFDNYLVLCKSTKSEISKLQNPSSKNNYYIPGQGAVRDKSTWTNFKSTLSSGTDYYFLTINYLSEGSYYGPYLEVIENFMEEEAMPRNIVKRYLNGYPSNF